MGHPLIGVVRFAFEMAGARLHQAALFEETLSAGCDGADSAERPGPSQVCSRRHEMPGFAIGFPVAADPASGGRGGQHLEGRDLADRLRTTRREERSRLRGSQSHWPGKVWRYALCRCKWG
jgi:hypothetical protein